MKRSIVEDRQSKNLSAAIHHRRSLAIYSAAKISDNSVDISRVATIEWSSSNHPPRQPLKSFTSQLNCAGGIENFALDDTLIRRLLHLPYNRFVKPDDSNS
jgi:hypothetical protein